MSDQKVGVSGLRDVSVLQSSDQQMDAAGLGEVPCPRETVLSRALLAAGLWEVQRGCVSGRATLVSGLSGTVAPIETASSQDTSGGQSGLFLLREKVGDSKMGASVHNGSFLRRTVFDLKVVFDPKMVSDPKMGAYMPR